MNEIFSSLFPSNDQILTDFMYFYNKIENESQHILFIGYFRITQRHSKYPKKRKRKNTHENALVLFVY
jgi:hypothetical protein